jgi:16S rRNA (guanine966-N2)-methyltransferase
LGEIRIIGGQWRGRKLTVLDHPGLRPTPDRLRETLFNWLNDSVIGSRCLDLFAGSGALGIEAASRGAETVLLVERESKIVQTLDRQLAKLLPHHIEVICADALPFLCKTPPAPFDIVFLDPPFDDNLLTPACQLLEQYQWLKPTAHLYLETERHCGKPQIPPAWQIIRQQTAGQVASFLCTATACIGR